MRDFLVLAQAAFHPTGFNRMHALEDSPAASRLKCLSHVSQWYDARVQRSTKGRL